MEANKGHVLYHPDSVVPVICEREDWRSCPEHRGLSEKRPELESAKVEFDYTDMGDDPDDDIVSVNEYAGSPKVSREQFSDDFWKYVTGTSGSSELREGLAKADKAGERALIGTLATGVVGIAGTVGLAIGGVIGGTALLALSPLAFAVVPLAFLVKKVVRKSIFNRKAKQVTESFKESMEKTGHLPNSGKNENLEYFMHLNKTLSKENADYYNADTFYKQNA